MFLKQNKINVFKKWLIILETFRATEGALRRNTSGKFYFRIPVIEFNGLGALFTFKFILTFFSGICFTFFKFYCV